MQRFFTEKFPFDGKNNRIERMDFVQNAKTSDLPEGRPPLAGDQQPQPPQQRNRRTMRMIQIQLLLSNTLHRQLFIVNLP